MISLSQPHPHLHTNNHVFLSRPAQGRRHRKSQCLTDDHPTSPSHTVRAREQHSLTTPLLQTVVCDSGDFATIGKYKPQDATTNPSLILAASKKPEYAKLIDDAVAYGVKHGKDLNEKIDVTFDNLLVQFGSEILKIVPGKVSTEVDARFSFDKDVSIQKALRIIDVRLHNIKIANNRSTDNFTSSTRRPALTSLASSSSSLPPGRVSRPPTSSRTSTASTAT